MKQIQPFQKHWLQLTNIVVCRLNWWQYGSRTPFQYRERLSIYDGVIPIIRIRRSSLWMGIPIPVRRHLYTESAPSYRRIYVASVFYPSALLCCSSRCTKALIWNMVWTFWNTVWKCNKYSRNQQCMFSINLLFPVHITLFMCYKIVYASYHS